MAREIAATVAKAELFLYPGDRHFFTDESLADYGAAATELVMERVRAMLARVGRDRFMPLMTRAARPDDAEAMARLINEIIAIGGTTALRQAFDAQGIISVFIAPKLAISCFVAIDGRTADTHVPTSVFGPIQTSDQTVTDGEAGVEPDHLLDQPGEK